MNRRFLAFAGLGTLAAAAGALLSWKHFAPTAAPSALTPDEATLAQSLFAQTFKRPLSDEPLKLADFQGQPLLLNFWATWCAPCIKEMPMLDAFAKAQSAQGWKVVGLAVDGPTPVRAFLTRQPVSFEVGLAGMDGVELAKSLGNRQGQLPYTVVLDRQGRIAHKKLGALTPDDLSAWASAMNRA